MKMTLIAAVAILGLLAPASPVAAAPLNECQPTGVPGQAPPCLTLVSATVCPTGPSSCQTVNTAAACSLNGAACITIYVLLMPDRNGTPGGGDATTSLVWQEANACGGLQRETTFCTDGKRDAILAL